MSSTTTNATTKAPPAMGDEPNPPQWPCDKDNAVVFVKPSITADEIRKLQESYQDYFDTEHQTFRADKDHFSNRRTAIFFEPGVYDQPALTLQVGYYVQVAGLGRTAADVTFCGHSNSDDRLMNGPYCPAYDLDHEIPAIDGGGHPYKVRGISLDTFWRCAEGFTIDNSSSSSSSKNGNDNDKNANAKKKFLWAVSQAAPIRRIHCQNNCDLYLSDETAYSSGGHMANCKISNGNLVFGTQQQFCCRSVTISSDSDNNNNSGQVHTGAWSNVFVDCIGTPPAYDGHNGGASVTVHTPTITVEKPYIIKDSDQNKDTFSLMVPQPRIRKKGDPPLGADLVGETDERRPLEQVYVAWAKVANHGAIDYQVANKINAALDQGKDVVLSPGIYHLNEPIQLKRSNQVLLGIGMATLVAPQDGRPCIQVASQLEGVRLAGIMFEASRIPDDRTHVASFIEWGIEGTDAKDNVDPGNPNNPGVMSDIFCRVGGSSLDRSVATDVMVRIHAGNVLGDNLWLWRADHVELGKYELPNFPQLGYHQTVQGEVPVKTGLEVNGDNVVIHGLAVEHTTEHQVIWRGENGQVHFYQSELPYDVSPDFAVKNYMGYWVEDTVENHILTGAGVYSNFRDFDVMVKSAIRHPKVFDMDAPQVINSFTKHLNNKGVIMTVVTDGQQNGGGPAVADGPPARFPAHREKMKPENS